MSVPLHGFVSPHGVPFVTAVLVQVPLTQLSVVQGFPSLHSAGFDGEHGFVTHVPSAGLQTFPAGHVTSVP